MSAFSKEQEDRESIEKRLTAQMKDMEDQMADYEEETMSLQHQIYQ